MRPPWAFEAGNQSKQRALAASRGPDQYQELSIVDAKVEMADRDVAVGIGFGESSERDRCHGLTLRGADGQASDNAALTCQHQQRDGNRRQHRCRQHLAPWHR